MTWWSAVRAWWSDTHTPHDPEKQAALDAQAELRRRLRELGVEVAVATRDRRRSQHATPYRRRADDAADAP